MDIERYGVAIEAVDDYRDIGSRPDSAGLPDTVPAQFSLDASGNVTALVGPDGNIQLGTASRRRIVLFGDSQTENNQDLGAFNFSALTQTGGTATLAGISSQTGQIIKVSRVAESGYFGTHQITTVGGNATFPVPGDTPSPATSRVRGDGVGAYTTFLAQYVNRNASRGWLHLANYRAGGELFHVVNNAAYGGDTTWGMLERIDHPDWGVTPYQAEWVSVFGGINDLTSGVSAATVIKNLREIYDYLRSRNYSIIAITLCPVIAGHAGHGVVEIDEGILTVNDWIRQYARTQPKMMLWDFFSVINDPTAATPTGKTGYIHPTDFIHFSPRGAWELSSLILSACQNMLPAVQNTLPSSVADSRAFSATIRQNQLNPLMQGTTGPKAGVASGTVPDNWTVSHTSSASSTAVASVVARTVADHGDAIGNMCQVVLTINADGESGFCRNTPSNNSTLEVGAWYYAEAAIRLINWADMEMPNLTYTMTVDGVSTGAVACQSAPSKAWGEQPTGLTTNLVMRTPNFYVPAGTSASGTMGVSWKSCAASASGTIQIGRAHLRKVVE